MITAKNANRYVLTSACLDTFIVGNDGLVDDQLLPVIFEPFHGRAFGARAKGRGLGLGLYITRQIVIAHGGRVELEQGPGERVTFAVTLPRGFE